MMIRAETKSNYQMSQATKLKMSLSLCLVLISLAVGCLSCVQAKAQNLANAKAQSSGQRENQSFEVNPPQGFSVELLEQRDRLNTQLMIPTNLNAEMHEAQVLEKIGSHSVKNFFRWAKAQDTPATQWARDIQEGFKATIRMGKSNKKQNKKNATSASAKNNSASSFSDLAEIQDSPYSVKFIPHVFAAAFSYRGRFDADLQLRFSDQSIRLNIKEFAAYNSELSIQHFMNKEGGLQRLSLSFYFN